jgi:ATP-dependent DNA ligase
MKGWYYEGYRHSLAAKGIKTVQRFSFLPAKFNFRKYDEFISARQLILSNDELADALVANFPELSPSYAYELVKRFKAHQDHQLNFAAKIATAQPKAAESIKKENVIFEPKYDGTRMIVEKEGPKLQFINRRGVVKNKTYPELADLNKQIKGNVVLDGEIVVLDKEHPYGNFEKLARRDRLKDIEEIQARSEVLPLTYVVFDILKKDNKNIADLPLVERKKILDNVIKQGKHIKEIEFSNKPDDLLKKVKRAKGEGIIQKDINSKYEPKSTRTWEKIKLLKTNDVAVTGYTEGTGKRKGYFGALKIAVNTPKGSKPMGKVGTGFTDADLKEITAKLRRNQDLVARIKFRGIGSAGRYLEPRFISLREDISQKQTHG